MKQRFLVLMVLIPIILTSCLKKENRIAHRLVRGDGKWEFKHIISVTNNGPSSWYYSQNALREGVVTFDENGTFVWEDQTGTTQSEVTPIGGWWSNSKEEVSLIFDTQAVQYTVDKSERKKFVLLYQQKYQESDGSWSEKKLRLHLAPVE